MSFTPPACLIALSATSMSEVCAKAITNRSEPMNAMNDTWMLPARTVSFAPRNLAEALDALQPFLLADRRMTLFGKGARDASISITTGDCWAEEITGYSHTGTKPGEPLSDRLFRAEADHAAKWQAKHGKSAAAEAEFGHLFVQVAA